MEFAEVINKIIDKVNWFTEEERAEAHAAVVSKFPDTSGNVTPYVEAEPLSPAEQAAADQEAAEKKAEADAAAIAPTGGVSQAAAANEAVQPEDVAPEEPTTEATDVPTVVTPPATTPVPDAAPTETPAPLTYDELLAKVAELEAKDGPTSQG